MEGVGSRFVRMAIEVVVALTRPCMWGVSTLFGLRARGERTGPRRLASRRAHFWVRGRSHQVHFSMPGLPPGALPGARPPAGRTFGPTTSPTVRTNRPFVRPVGTLVERKVCTTPHGPKKVRPAEEHADRKVHGATLGL